MVGESHSSRPRLRPLPLSWTGYLIGWFVPFWLTPRRMQSAGLGVVPIVLALVLTMAFYAAANAWLAERIDSSYRTLILPEVVAADRRAAAGRVVELGWADARLLPWLETVAEVPSAATPAHRQIEAFFASDLPRHAEDRVALLRQLATGEREVSGYLGSLARLVGVSPGLAAQLEQSSVFPVSLKTSTGAEACERLAAFEDKAWLRVVETRSRLGNEKKQFLARYVDAFLARMQEPIRDMQRINGWVQWLTIWVTFVILFVVVQRGLLLLAVRHAGERIRKRLGTRDTINLSPLPATNELGQLLHVVYAEGPSSGKREEGRRQLGLLRDTVELGVYGTLGYLVTLLPSMGFLGTVMGLGDALLRADGLFSQVDRQRVINLITRDLGFAFDTTLVALVTGMLVGLPLAYLRLRERMLLRDWECTFLAGD